MPFRALLLDDAFLAAWRRMLHLVRPLLVWTLLVWAAVTVVLAPITSTLIGWQLLRGERVVIGNEEIVAWFLTPGGFLYVILAGGVAITAAVVRYAGVFRIVTDDLEGRRASVRRTVLRLAPLVPVIYKLCVVTVLGAVVLALPLLLGLLGVRAMLLSAHDVNYYLAVRPPEWWWAVGIGGLWTLLWAVGAGSVAGRSVLGLPAYLDGHRPLRAAVKRSWALARGRTFRLLRLLGLAVGAWLLARVAVQGAYLAGSAAIVEWTASSGGMRAVATSASLLLAGSILLDAVIGFLGFSFVSTLITKFYFEDTELHRNAPPPRRVRGLPARTFAFAHRWLRSRRVVSVVLSLLLASVLASAVILDWIAEPRPVEIHAHRAGPPPSPENTLAALERSIAAGAEYAEIDVLRTRDGVVIVIHDADFMRVAGDPRRVADVDYDAVRDLVQRPDDGTPPGERRVATLAEFIERARGRIGLNIELKYYGWDPELAPRVIREVRSRGMEEEVVLMSLSARAVRQVARLAPELRVGYVAALTVGDVTALPADFVAVSRGMASRRLIRAARARGMAVHVWTVNDREAMAELIALGVDGLITDDPALAVDVRDRMMAMPMTARLLLPFGGLEIGDGEAAEEREPADAPRPAEP